MSQPDFSNEQVDNASSALEAIANLVTSLDEALLMETRAQAALDEASRQVRHLTDKLIPEMMEQFGMKALTLSDGRKLEVKPKLIANIKADDRPAAFEWFREKGYDALIKSTVTVDVQGEDAVVGVASLLAENGHVGTIDEKIHPQTLNAWASEYLATGGALPPVITVQTFSRASLRKGK